MKQRILAALIVLLLLLCVAGCVTIRLPGGSESGGTSIWWGELNGDAVIGGGSVSAADVRRLRIDWIAGEVNVVAGTGDAITIEETADGVLDDDERLRFAVQDGELRIVYCRPSLTTLRIRGKTLTVSVPAPLCESLGSLRFEVVSADVTVAGLSGEKLELDTVSGGLSASEGRFDEVDVDTVSGNASLRMAALPEKVDFDAVSGSLILTLPGGNSGFTLELDTVSGDLDCALPVTITGDRYVYGDGACRIDCDTVSGNVRVRMEEE